MPYRGAWNKHQYKHQWWNNLGNGWGVSNGTACEGSSSFCGNQPAELTWANVRAELERLFMSEEEQQQVRASLATIYQNPYQEVKSFSLLTLTKLYILSVDFCIWNISTGNLKNNMIIMETESGNKAHSQWNRPYNRPKGNPKETPKIVCFVLNLMRA